MKILVTSSNEYLKLLPAFAHLFNRHYGFDGRSLPAVTVLRYDVRPPALPENFGQYAVGPQADFTWSAGLKNYLEWMRTNEPDELYILLLCEDYFLTGVDHEGVIGAAYQFMVDNEFVGKIDLSGDLAKRIEKSGAGGPVEGTPFVEATAETPWLASIQAAIWHRDFLVEFLDASETPWQLEKKGTKRIAKDMAANPEELRILGVAKPALEYVNACGGEGKKPGVLDLKRVPADMLAELKEKNLV